jgi:hypothetical protein
MVLAITLFVYAFRSTRQEEAKIRARYQQMRTALSSGDTNGVRALFAPDFRGEANRQFDRLLNFAKPLGGLSAVRFSRSRASVCPERISHFGIVPGGHTIEMVKIDGDWFFTGKVSID